LCVHVKSTLSSVHSPSLWRCVHLLCMSLCEQEKGEWMQCSWCNLCLLCTS
jgi:hypothetical protein